MPAAVAATGTTRSEEVRSVKSSFILIITRVCPQAFVDEAEIRYKIGVNTTKRENARKMKQLGATTEFITQVTGLTAEKIDAL